MKITRLHVLVLFAGALASLASLSAWYRSEATRLRAQAEASARALRQKSMAFDQLLARQLEAAATDAKHQRELSDAHTENNRLRRQLDAGGRMYVRAAPGMSAHAGSGSLGDAARVGLPDNTGRHVLDIRAGILADRQKIAYLQEFIRMQCHPAR